MENTVISKNTELKQKVSHKVVKEMVSRTSTSRENHRFSLDPNDVSDNEMSELVNKAKSLPRIDWRKDPTAYSVKVCPTRHGCSGATDCDNSYGDYRR